MEISDRRNGLMGFEKLIQYPRRYLIVIAFLLGSLLLVFITSKLDWPPPLYSDDIYQPRANTPLPSPNGTSQIRQTFKAQHDGLTSIELLVARKSEEPSGGFFNVQIMGPGSQVIASKEWSSDSLTHNQVVYLDFPPQINSAGEEYSVLISGTPQNRVTIWGYDLDLIDDTTLTVIGIETAAEELRLTTQYQLTFGSSLSELGRILRNDSRLIGLTLAMLFMPGSLLLLIRGMKLPISDPGAWLGIVLAIGMSTWPLIWLWITIVDAQWHSWSLSLFLLLGWAIVIGTIIFRLGQQILDRSDHSTETRRSLNYHITNLLGNPKTRLRALGFSWQHGILLIILLGSLVVRLLAVRDLSFPPWVDSGRHALITAVMSENGQWLQNYEPYLPVYRFPYHAGFHTISATLVLLTKQELPGMLLTLGQLLNSFIPLMIYTGAYLVTRRRNAALIASFLVAFPFYFPGYYASWGRMTQLTAVLVLAVTIPLTWCVLNGARSWRRYWWILVLLIAGIFLIHFRVFLLYIPYFILVFLIGRGRALRTAALVTVSSFALVFPKAMDLFQYASPERLSFSTPGYNDFPIGYLDAGWERFYLYAGLLALVFTIIAFIRRRIWARYPLLLAVWVGLVALLLAGDRLNLPKSDLLNINSAYIVFFVPLAWLLAITIDVVWRWFLGQRIILTLLFTGVMGAIVTATLITGVWQQINIINPQTVLATSNDRSAIDWVEEHVPSSAKIAVSSWKWLGNTWASSDGGGWLLPLTGIETTTPPPDYNYSMPLARDVRAFNEKAEAIEDWSDPASVLWLKESGITHIFIGSEGGFFDPSMLVKNPLTEQIFSSDGAFVFALR